MKTLVIGLDCLSPELIEVWQEKLPHFAQLQRAGIYGRLRTTRPPITVPAWRSIFSGRDPGELGVYGFRNRPSYTTKSLSVVKSGDFQEDPIWLTWSSRGESCAILNVPGTFPCQGMADWEIACLLTPSQVQDWCHPPQLANEIEKVLGGEAYPFDVASYRRTDSSALIAEVTRQTKIRFQVLRHILQVQKPQHCIFVDLGCDRMHHRFWEESPGPTPTRWLPPGGEELLRFYQFLDEELGKTLSLVDWPIAKVLVLSDHGAVACRGGFHLNKWLESHGWLRRKAEYADVKGIHLEQIEWSKTTAWAEGGYYGRIFLNVQGREPAGIVHPAEYEKPRSMLTHELRKLVCPGSAHSLLVERPEEVYRSVRNIAPDLFVYDSGLHWRFLAGWSDGEDFWSTTDPGLDRANHSWHGYFACWHPQGKYPPVEEGVLDYLEVHPWLLGESPSLNRRQQKKAAPPRAASDASAPEI